jgi:hypothetical protein
MPLDQKTIDKLAEAAADPNLPEGALALFEAIAEELAATKDAVAAAETSLLAKGDAIITAIQIGPLP